jgi:hydrogenase-4 membrane subunit HyfE
MTELLTLLLVITGSLIVLEHRMARVLTLCSVQGVLLIGVVIEQRRDQPFWHFAALLALLGGLKVVLIPWLLARADRRAAWLAAEEEPPLSPRDPAAGFKMSEFLTLSLLLVGFFFSLSFARLFSLHPGSADELAIALSLMVIFTGLMTFVLRANWIVLMVGFTLFENGIFLLATLLRADLPLGVEFGTFADAVLAIVVGASLQIWAAQSPGGKKEGRAAR